MAAMTARATSLPETPDCSWPVTVTRMALALRCNRHWVASTWPTSDVPMPKAKAPKAPCVAVWLSPQTTVFGAPARQRHPMSGAVLLQPMHLGLGLGGDIGFQPVQPRRQGRGRMVQGRIGPVGAAHLQAARLDLAEGLRAGDLMDQVQVDIQNPGRVDRLVPHDVGVPDLVEQGFWIRHTGPPSPTRRPRRR